MENIVVKETANILKKLSPKNQAYFMTLVRVADIAESSVKEKETVKSLEPDKMANSRIF